MLWPAIIYLKKKMHVVCDQRPAHPFGHLIAVAVYVGHDLFTSMHSHMAGIHDQRLYKDTVMQKITKTIKNKMR